MVLAVGVVDCDEFPSGGKVEFVIFFVEALIEMTRRVAVQTGKQFGVHPRNTGWRFT